MELDFDALVKNYTDNLQSTLRNFSPGPDFLDTWVHEEDANRSVAGIFDAAQVAGMKQVLSLKVSPRVTPALRLKELETELKNFGEVVLILGEKSLVIQVDLSKAPQNPKSTYKIKKSEGLRKSHGSMARKPSVRISFETAVGRVEMSEVYEAAITVAANLIEREGVIAGNTQGQILAANEGKVRLECLVSDRGNVLLAKHSGSAGLEKIILDQFCLIIEGLTLQEASEHGIIRLEFYLRNKAMPFQVPGIVTPENSDPVFTLPNSLIRSMFTRTVKESGAKVPRNFWSDRVDDSWRALSKSEKLSQVSHSFMSAAARFGLQTTGIEFVDIKSDTRVILTFAQDPAYPPVGNYLMKIERVLKESLEPQIELMLESRDDTNKRNKSRAETETVQETNT